MKTLITQIPRAKQSLDRQDFGSGVRWPLINPKRWTLKVCSRGLWGTGPLAVAQHPSMMFDWRSEKWERFRAVWLLDVACMLRLLRVSYAMRQYLTCDNCMFTFPHANSPSRGTPVTHCASAALVVEPSPAGETNLEGWYMIFWTPTSKRITIFI